MDVSADLNRCVAAGLRVSIAAQVFDQQEDDGKVVVIDSHPPRPSSSEKAGQQDTENC
jgi:ferredoxin